MSEKAIFKTAKRLEDWGKWKRFVWGKWEYAKCPFCGVTCDIPTNYCPQCGKDMRKEDEKMEIDMRTEREYIEKRRLTTIDEKGIKYWACEEVGELIRRKDCKYYVNGVCFPLKGIFDVVSDMDYCSRGERRDSNDTDTD